MIIVYIHLVPILI